MSKPGRLEQYDMYDKVSRYLLEKSPVALHTGEGRLILGIICQSMQDAMGLYKASKEKVYITKSGESIGRRKFITRQQEAVEWFRSGQHYIYCDVILLDRELIDELLITKCGVNL